MYKRPIRGFDALEGLQQQIFDLCLAQGMCSGKAANQQRGKFNSNGSTTTSVCYTQTCWQDVLVNGRLLQATQVDTHGYMSLQG